MPKICEILSVSPEVSYGPNDSDRTSIGLRLGLKRALKYRYSAVVEHAAQERADNVSFESSTSARLVGSARLGVSGP